MHSGIGVSIRGWGEHTKRHSCRSRDGINSSSGRQRLSNSSKGSTSSTSSSSAGSSRGRRSSGMALGEAAVAVRAAALVHLPVHRRYLF